MANALFVCLHNAGRSQMSEALLKRLADDRHDARSAGTIPGERVHPEVVEAMAELGIDLSDRVPRLLSAEDAEWADVVVTMGCGDKCPYVPGVRYVDWDLPDPKGQPVAAVRRTRDEIARRVEALVAELDATAGEPERPVACSLGAGALTDRLAAAAEIGRGSLIGRGMDEGRHVLRFHRDPDTRRRLEDIVHAEAECCAFLELSLSERGKELILSIGAPESGRPIAAGLASAFGQEPA